MTSGVPTGQMIQALVNHYQKPGETRTGEILIKEAQAPGSQRRCDLIRVGLWASRGTGIDGHEIKTSRSDWLRELDDPEKAEAWWPYCSRWWLVAPPGIVMPGELPEGWGLMELPSSGRRFKVKVPAATKAPKLTISLMIELLRRADNERLAEMSTLRGIHRDELFKQEREIRAEKAQAELPYDMKHRLDLLERMEKVLGVPLDTFGGHSPRPLIRMSAEELAAFLADAGEHVTAQRRAKDADRQRDHLLGVARGLVVALERDLT